MGLYVGTPINARKLTDLPRVFRVILLKLGCPPCRWHDMICSGGIFLPTFYTGFEHCSCLPLPGQMIQYDWYVLYTWVEILKQPRFWWRNDRVLVANCIVLFNPDLLGEMIQHKHLALFFSIGLKQTIGWHRTWNWTLFLPLKKVQELVFHCFAGHV